MKHTSIAIAAAIAALLSCSCSYNSGNQSSKNTIPENAIYIDNLRCRDPFVIVADGKYYFMASRSNPDLGRYIEAYESTDLKYWVSKGNVVEMPDGYLGTNDWWAPDTYFYNGKYYIFVTMSNKDKGILRGTTILRSDNGVLGPYKPVLPIDRLNVTPNDYQCLDGSLYVDGEGNPWMLYCVEWIGPNVKGMVGEIWAVRLKKDLSDREGEPHYLFKASDAPWPTKKTDGMVTDAPFITPDPATGNLIMTWSSFGPRYGIIQAISRNGVLGPWEQIAEPVFTEDGGHCTVFKDLQGKWKMSFHCPNSKNETLTIKDVEIVDGKFRIVE